MTDSEIKQTMTVLREILADIEHDQWVTWSKSIAATEVISPERLLRWEKLWVPYDELSEEAKDQDRIWADKSIAALEECLGY
jgi:hypothetical protein